MTSQQNPEPNANEGELQLDQSSQPKPPKKPWLLSLLILILLGMGGGLAYGGYFISYQLSPTVAKALSKILSRPLEMGELQGFSLTTITFGKTVLPPQDNYSEAVIIPSIEVNYTPIKLFTQQKLELDVTLINPDITVEQTNTGEWLTTSLTEQPPGAIDIELKTLNVKNADLSLSPRNANGELLSPVDLNVEQIRSQFFDNNQRIRFQLETLTLENAQGNLNLEGEAKLESGDIKVAVSSNNLAIGNLARLVTSPVDIVKGTLNADTDITLSLDGSLPSFQGNLQISDLEAKLDPLTTPIQNTNLSVRLAEKNIILEEFTTELGDINATARGRINLATGYDLNANLPPTPISRLLSAVNLESPDLPLSGVIEADIAITGPLENPKINVAARSVEPTQIDRLQIRTFQTNISLQGTNVIVENFAAFPSRGGQVTANGTLNLTPEQNISVDVQLKDIPGEIIRPYQPNLPSDLGTLNATGKLNGSLSDWKTLEGEGKANLDIADGSVTLSQLQLSQSRLEGEINLNNLQPQKLLDQPTPPQLENPISGQFAFNTDLSNLSPEKITLNGQGTLNIPEGEFAASSITLADGQLEANFQLTNLPITLIAPQTPPEFQNPISGEFRLRGDIANLSPDQLRLSGGGRLNLPQGELAASNITLADGQLEVNFRLTNLPITLIAPQTPPEFQNPISGEFRLRGDIANLSPDQLRLSGGGRLNLPQGELAATDITFQDQRLQASFNVTRIPLGLFLPDNTGDVNEFVSAKLNVDADLGGFDLNQIQGSSFGEISFSNQDSQIVLRNLRLNRGNWEGEIEVSNFNPSPFVPELPPELKDLRVSTQLTTSGTLDNLTPQGIDVQGTAILDRILGGKITANVIRLQQGEFNLVASPQNLDLSQLSPQLDNNSVEGEVIVSGTLDNLTATGLKAQANLDFNQGLAVITDPLTTSIRWDGQQVTLEQVEAKNFFATGTIGVNLEKEGMEIIEQLDLNVDAQDLDLSQLPLPQPELVGKINVQGLANFSGRVRGSLTQPEAQGDIRLENFAVERFRFDPQMVGGVQVNTRQGMILDLRGNERNFDRIQIGLLSPQPNNILPLEPLSLLIKRNESIIRGERYDDEFDLSLEALPLDLLKDFAPLTEEFATQPASGELQGDLTVNLNNYNVSGQVALVDPAFGRFNLDRAIANFRYGDNTITLQQATVIENESEYQANGELIFTETTPNFKANLNIKQGRIEDILSALQIFDLSDFNTDFATPDYGSVDDLNIAEVNVKDQSVETQLRRFSEIKALLQQLRDSQEVTPTLPPLTTAKGNFTGNLNFQGTSFDLAAIQGEFRLDGNQWRWGPYQAQSVETQGKIENGIITFVPVRVTFGDSLINLSGTFGGQNQSAQLQVEQVPIEVIQNFVELPEFIGVSGFINASATVAGTPENPTARGELKVAEATLNEKSIDTIQGSFSYSNAQLNFFAQGLLNPDSDPLILTGDLPYQLPFATTPPSSSDLNVEINLVNEGFNLLDVITNEQLTWQGGEGEVNLAISGPFKLENFQFDQLTTRGIVTLNDATIGTPLLPDPVTNIQTTVNFNFDQLTVQEFNANFGGGTIQAIGGLPLFDRNVSTDTLDIQLQNVTATVPNLYAGGVDGNINISETALEPEIGGEITLSQGKVTLAEAETPTPATEETPTEPSNIGFSNLKINLGDRINVVRPPIMDFVANGDLTINGTLDNLRPQGTITLQRGLVNLGPTQFRLAGGYEQTAIFVPSQGLDPTLNVRLVASVAETTGNVNQESPSPQRDDPTTPGLPTLQSVQVEALVEGRASELQPGDLTASRNNVLTLSSDPNRSETEILALLGGGLTSGFGQGNTALGLANLAGSTFLGTFQNTIGDLLGLSEFRIFPTLIPTETEEGQETNATTLGFGAEAGLEINNDFSFSVLTVFNAQQAFQYSIRYRLGDDVLIRGTTDLSDSESLTVEYETRF